MKVVPAVVLLLFLSFLMVPVIASVSSGNTYPSIYQTSLTVTPSQSLYEGENFTVYLNSTYGFPLYTSMIFVYGSSLAGLKNSTSQSYVGSSYTMSVNFTAPMYVQTLYILGVSYVNTSTTSLVSKSYYSVQILPPLDLSVELSNPSKVPLYNLTVNFSLDGALKGSKHIAELAPYSTITVTLQVALQLSQGLHSMTVTVSNPSASINGQQASYQNQFYYGTPPNYTWIYYIAAAVIAFMVLLALSAGRRTSRLKKPKWKK
ncbi:MAG: hypothetical protein M1267_03080 [Candidatus Thermoplasmatota archaeon]|jgi:hypothetical protein|nr:hypothetical protein [Candidatus Thermoplasmatota archaeon]MCL5800100.1 hypothetical protein [Candidatus Thermoplasmatota archaeon]